MGESVSRYLAKLRVGRKISMGGSFEAVDKEYSDRHPQGMRTKESRGR